MRDVGRELLTILHLLEQNLSELSMAELGPHLGDDEFPTVKEVRNSMVAPPGKPKQVNHPVGEVHDG
eukprot:3001757-Heterocapsa_arctica.AAC.1